MEESDAITQAGLAALALKVVAPARDRSISSIDDLVQYAKASERTFLDGVTRERLFVPAEVAPEDVGSAEEAASIYLSGLKGYRDQRMADSGNLAAVISDDTTAAAATNGPAYDRYLQEMALFRRGDIASMQRAISELEESVALDPDLAPAGRSWLRSTGTRRGYTPRQPLQFHVAMGALVRAGPRRAGLQSSR